MQIVLHVMQDLSLEHKDLAHAQSAELESLLVILIAQRQFAPHVV
jgi:hypothetical protein